MGSLPVGHDPARLVDLIIAFVIFCRVPCPTSWYERHVPIGEFNRRFADHGPKKFEEDQPFISMISLPMRWQGRIMGVIHVLDNTKVRSFSEEDVRMLDLFANQAAMAVENARLFKETSQRAQQAAVLAEVGRDISESLDLDVTLGRIASYAKELLRANSELANERDENGNGYADPPQRTTDAVIALDGLPFVFREIERLVLQVIVSSVDPQVQDVSRTGIAHPFQPLIRIVPPVFGRDQFGVGVG